MAFSHLSRDERAALHGYTARATWPAGFQIYARGAAADGVFVVEYGSVVLRSQGRSGRGFVPWMATPGETFGAEGLSQNGTYCTDARADTEAETLFMSSAKMRALTREHPAHALALVGQVMAERAALLEKLREIATLSVEQRISTALQRIAAQEGLMDDTGRIELCSSRYRLLCELVGATRESVALVLGRLAGEGVVERVGGTLYVRRAPLVSDGMGTSDDGLAIAGFADASRGELAPQ